MSYYRDSFHPIDIFELDVNLLNILVSLSTKNVSGFTFLIFVSSSDLTDYIL